MAALGDRAHQTRIALGDHPEHEERPTRAASFAEIEEILGRRHDAAGKLAQLGAAHGRRELHPVVVLLDVHREDVEEWGRCLRQHGPPPAA